MSRAGLSHDDAGANVVTDGRVSNCGENVNRIGRIQQNTGTPVGHCIHAVNYQRRCTTRGRFRGLIGQDARLPVELHLRRRSDLAHLNHRGTRRR